MNNAGNKLEDINHLVEEIYDNDIDLIYGGQKLIDLEDRSRRNDMRIDGRYSRNSMEDMGRLRKKVKFSIEDFFSKFNQIGSFLRIWSNLLLKFFMENFIFSAVCSRRNLV